MCDFSSLESVAAAAAVTRCVPRLLFTSMIFIFLILTLIPWERSPFFSARVIVVVIVSLLFPHFPCALRAVIFLYFYRFIFIFVSCLAQRTQIHDGMAAQRRHYISILVYCRYANNAIILPFSILFSQFSFASSFIWFNLRDERASERERHTIQPFCDCFCPCDSQHRKPTIGERGVDCRVQLCGETREAPKARRTLRK